MIISDEQLDEFISIYQSEFGILLEREEAYHSASVLVRLMKTLIKESGKTQVNPME